MPGAQPAQPQTANTFVLNVAPDPNWEPFQSTDVLEKDGYYCGRIVKESSRTDSGKKPGVFFEFQLQDPDVQGKRLMKFLADPNATEKNTWWNWRALMRSVMGDTNAGKAGFQYTLGMFTNGGCLVYFKTEAYLDDGAMRTGVSDFITKAEYEQAAQGGRHRWAAKAPQAGGHAGAGALPGGLPQSFVGMGLPPGGPTAPGAPAAAPSFPPVTQQPPQQPPMQQAPQQPPQQQQAPSFGGAPAFVAPGAPSFAPPAQSTQPAFAPPAAGTPPPFAPPANGTQQPPSAAGMATSFKFPNT
jgi:hypothetical protein